MATAKQKAWRKRFGEMARAGKFKKSTSHSKKRIRGYKMARRKGGFRKGKGKKSFFGLSSKGLIGNFGLMGIVGAALAAPMVSQKAQELTGIAIPYADYAAAYAIAGPAGIAAKVGKDMLMPTMSSGNGWNF